MAEVTRSVTTTTTSSITARQGTKVASEVTKEAVRVRSFTEDRLTVSNLLDFADAVRAAGLSSKVLVHRHSSGEGHLTGLYADETRDVAVAEQDGECPS